MDSTTCEVVRLEGEVVDVTLDRPVSDDELRRVGATLSAAQLLGIAIATQELATAYAKQREQFGRPIGSFQAIKHLCADMLLLVESARSAAYSAACVAADGSEGLAVAASLASAYCGDAYFRCAGDAIQIHGGVGFTWEYDPHLHFKRARASQSLLGDPAWHRERVARALGL